MIRAIIQAPADCLRIVAEPVPDAPLEEHLNAILDLQDTFKATTGCIGLAANQIGHCFRIIVVDTTQNRRDTYLMVNPIITKASDDMQRVNDGCMSIGGGKKRGITKRPKRITVEWTDPADGAKRKQKSPASRLRRFITRLITSTAFSSSSGSLLTLPRASRPAMGTTVVPVVRILIAGTNNMGNYITLLGAENVQSAGATIAAAAESMRFAGSNIDDSMRRAMDRFEELVSRFEAAVDRVCQPVIEGAQREG